MPTFFTFDLTPNSKAVTMATNDLAASVEIDYLEITILLDSISRLVLEEVEANGTNIILKDKTKFTIQKEYVTRIGTVNAPFATNKDVKTALENLIGL